MLEGGSEGRGVRLIMIERSLTARRGDQAEK